MAWYPLVPELSAWPFDGDTPRRLVVSDDGAGCADGTFTVGSVAVKLVVGSDNPSTDGDADG